jgi:hypothetical protein
MDSRMVPAVSHSVQVDHGTSLQARLNSTREAVTAAKQMSYIQAQAHGKGVAVISRVLPVESS